MAPGKWRRLPCGRLLAPHQTGWNDAVAEKAKIRAHSARVTQAAPLSPEEEAALVQRHLAIKGPTQCPPGDPFEPDPAFGLNRRPTRI